MNNEIKEIFEKEILEETGMKEGCKMTYEGFKLAIELIRNKTIKQFEQKEQEYNQKIKERIDAFENDIKQFQNFGSKSKVIIRLNQLREELNSLLENEKE